MKFRRISPLRCVAASLLGTYILWNALWMSKGLLAPSLMKGITGLPGPTTGFWRATKCLYFGAVVESLRFQPMVVPIFILSVITFLALIFHGKRLSLAILGSRWLPRAWIVILMCGWISKLTGNPVYW